MGYQEFATEEEMREILGDDAKGFDFKSGWAVRTNSVDAREYNSFPSSTKEVFIGAYVGSSIMYIAKKGTTFIKANAKSFSEDKANAKVAAMNRCGTYHWQKIEKS